MDYPLPEKDLLEHKQAHVPVEGDSKEQEPVHCFFCGKLVDESDIGIWEPAGRRDLFLICNDCIKEIERAEEYGDEEEERPQE